MDNETRDQQRAVQFERNIGPDRLLKSLNEALDPAKEELHP